MPRSHRKAVALAAAGSLPLLAVALPATATPGTHAVRGNAPSWARAAALTGHPQAGARLTVRVGLAPRDPAGAAAVAAAVSDPRSPSYRHYLTPAQYLARFGPTAAQVGQVRSFLSGAGLTVRSVAPSRESITASGTVAQLERAFDTTLGLYRHAGHTLRAPSSPAQVPAALAPLIASVGGLTDTSHAVRPLTVKPAAPVQSAQVPTPCSSYYGENHVANLPEAYGTTSFPTANCGYQPAQLRGAYGLDAANSATSTDGHGVTVAIIDAYALSTMASDAQTYSARNGLPAFQAGQYAEYPPTQAYYDQAACDPAGWGGEEALDVEAVHSMAPGAGIAYVPTSSCNDQDFLDAYDRILAPSGNASTPLATIVSNSYGDTSDLLPGDLQNEEHQLFVQGAAEGVGFYFSSGDDGDAALDNNGVPQPQASANDPAVTAVGGTTLGVTKDNGYGFETGWGDTRTVLVTDRKTKQLAWQDVPGTFYAGAGGGTSSVWGEPDYQKGVVPASLANAASGDKGPGRVVPDVAAVADPYTGFLEGYSVPTKKGTVYTEGDIGGTSLACPTFAGVMAVAQQRGGGAPIGFANPLLYSFSGSQAFHDVRGPANADQSAVVYSPNRTTTRLVSFNLDSSLNTARGYDDVTGLGSPAAGFVAAVAGG